MDRVTKRAVGAVNEWARRNDVSFHTPVTVAVSGGADSLALMIAVAKSRFKNVSVLTVDHGIQKSSGEQAQKVVQQARSLGLDARIAQVSSPCREGQGNLEAEARAGRYEIFAEYPVVLLAHTVNDQMETMLLGMARGSGSRSISGMREFRDRRYGRPFLSLTRADTQAVCEVNGLEVWDDPHNEHIAFKRIHVRQRIIPSIIEVFGEGILKNFGRTAFQLQEDSDALDQWALAATPAETTKEYLPDLGDIPVAVKKRILKKWLESWTNNDEAIKSAIIENTLTLESGKMVMLSDKAAVHKVSRAWRIFLR